MQRSFFERFAMRDMQWLYISSCVNLARRLASLVELIIKLSLTNLIQGRAVSKILSLYDYGV